MQRRLLFRCPDGLRMVQDVTAMQEIVIMIHQTVPNPYHLLGNILLSSVLDRARLDWRDTFFLYSQPRRHSAFFIFRVGYGSTSSGFRGKPLLWGWVQGHDLQNVLFPEGIGTLWLDWLSLDLEKKMSERDQGSNFLEKTPGIGRIVHVWQGVPFPQLAQPSYSNHSSNCKRCL